MPGMMRVFERTRNNHPIAVGAVDSNGELLGVMTAVRIQTLPDPLRSVSSRAVAFAEPIVDQRAESGRVLKALISEYEQRLSDEVLFTEIRPLGTPGAEKAVLQRLGYDHYRYLNYTVDLRQSPQQLWWGLSKSCRKNIRRSERRGVTVRDMTTTEGIDLLYRFLRTSYRRSRIPLADKSLFTAALAELADGRQLTVRVACVDQRPIAAGVLLAFKEMVYAWYGGSERLQGLAPFDCLTWSEICWAHKQGYACYDFGGAGFPDEPYGPRDFKAKFGGQLVNFGRYRKVHAPLRFRVARGAYAVGRHLMALKRK